MKNDPQNLLDKAIAYVAPRVAARRMQARVALALAGGYNGASYGRPGLAGWSPRASDAVADTNYDLPQLRARTRDLARNAPLAAGAISTQVTNVVGTGLSLQPTPDAELLGIEDEAAQAWADARQRHADDERTWNAALYDARIMADLSRAMNGIAVEDIRRFDAEFLDFIDRSHPEVFDAIRTTTDLSDDTVSVLEGAIGTFKRQYTTTAGHLLVNDEPVAAVADEEIDHTQIKRAVRG